MQLVANTPSVDAGETYDIVFLANNPGVWVFHCHELHHTTNDDVELGGLIQVIQYEGYTLPAAERRGDNGSRQPLPAPTMPANMPGVSH